MVVVPEPFAVRFRGVDWRLFIFSALALAIAVVSLLRVIQRERRDLRVSGQCISVPGCTVLVVKVTKVGMTPVQLELVGVMWGRLTRKLPIVHLPWGQQAGNVYIVSMQRPDRPSLHFTGEVYSEEIPMEELASAVLEHGRPSAVVVTTADGRYFYGRLLDEVWAGLQSVAANQPERA
jgi:hypothetical protein